MPAFESLAEAAEALAEANSADEAPATPVASEQAPAEGERASGADDVTTPAQVEAEGATVEDSFTKVDLASLIEGLDPEAASRVEDAYKSFQSDYTRKTQEAAPYRKIAEEFGGDHDEMRQSIEFVQNLRTDPDFAVSVYHELSDALQEAGLTEHEAQAEALSQVTEAADSPLSGASDFDPEDPRDRVLQELMEFKNDYEEMEMERELEAEIQRQEMAIRQTNPAYTDEDMDEIVKLSFAYGGDLFRAEKDYGALRERWLSSYVDNKGSVEAVTPSPVTPSPHAQQPQSFDSVDDAHKAAMRHLAAVLANE